MLFDNNERSKYLNSYILKFWFLLILDLKKSIEILGENKGKRLKEIFNLFVEKKYYSQLH